MSSAQNHYYSVLNNNTQASLFNEPNAVDNSIQRLISSTGYTANSEPMYQDLHLPFDDVNTVVHRDRLAMLLCLGYESTAAVHSTSARLTETDR